VTANRPVHSSHTAPTAVTEDLFGARLPAARVVDRVDPFALDADELRLLDLLGPPHFVTTPRQVKRLANSYGLLTTLRHHQRPADLAEQSCTVEDSPDELREVTYRPYRAGMVLLAALVAFPALGPGMFLHLHHSAAKHPYRSWRAFLGDLEPQRDGSGWHNRGGLPLDTSQAVQWHALTTALRHAEAAAAKEDLAVPEAASAWASWVIPVGRLSFPTGRVVSTLDRYTPIDRQRSGAGDR
jgi:hypothetical protein